MLQPERPPPPQPLRHGWLPCVVCAVGALALWTSSSGLHEQRAGKPTETLRLVLFKLPRSGSTWLTTSLNSGKATWARRPDGGRVFLSEEAFKTEAVAKLNERWPPALVGNARGRHARARARLELSASFTASRARARRRAQARAIIAQWTELALTERVDRFECVADLDRYADYTSLATAAGLRERLRAVCQAKQREQSAARSPARARAHDADVAIGFSVNPLHLVGDPQLLALAQLDGSRKVDNATHLLLVLVRTNVVEQAFSRDFKAAFTSQKHSGCFVNGQVVLSQCVATDASARDDNETSAIMVDPAALYAEAVARMNDVRGPRLSLRVRGRRASHARARARDLTTPRAVRYGGAHGASLGVAAALRRVRGPAHRNPGHPALPVAGRLRARDWKA